MELLRLGRIDANVHLAPEDKRAYFDLYHHPHGFDRDELRFRDDSRNLWRAVETINGQRIVTLTRFLQSAGFMPHATHDGIFGYITQAAVRLFQEYVRTEDTPGSEPPECWPDGVVGPSTQAHIDRWRADRLTARWRRYAPSRDHLQWFDWLDRAADFYRVHPSPSMQAVVGATALGDTLPPQAWRFDPRDPHLIGIRRNAQKMQADNGKRNTDDLFVLLINGNTFYFFGSTDPNPSSRSEAYLTEGQHVYRFNWHNIGVRRRERIYKAARPAGAGVLVLRDVHGHNALTETNVRDGFDPAPNPTINIHWSGLGHSNWSAGCQVIAGARYVDDRGRRVDCTSYAARNDRERGTRRVDGGPRLSMGAYTVLSDLLLAYTTPTDPAQKPTFRYTLFSERALQDVPGLDLTPLTLLQANYYGRE